MKRQPAKNFQDLIVWKKAHQFVLLIYRFSNAFAKNELYELTSQTRRRRRILTPDSCILVPDSCIPHIRAAPVGPA